MKAKAIVLALGLAIAALVPQFAEAIVYMHYFDCKFCHQSGLTFTQIADQSVCLQCHKNADVTTTLNANPPAGLDGVTQGRFSTGDASDAFDHNPTLKNKQTSHNWGASDNQPAAGASAPNATAYPGFTTRYGGSAGKVTCSRCHNPHGFNDNPKLLVKSTTIATSASLDPETMCRACHKSWADAKDAQPHAWLSHTLVADYDTTISGKTDKFYTSAEFSARDGLYGDLQLVNGGIGCTSCHGLHYTDSSSATADGVANKATLTSGDGKLLRTDGRTPSAIGSFAPSSVLCSSCHKGYSAHGSNQHSTDYDLGCLDCHSGHSYNPNDPAVPNYYVLRGTIKNVYRPINTIQNPPVIGDVATLSYTAAAGAPWMTTDNKGYCQQCHTSLASPHYNGLTSGTAASDSCGSCHTHNNGSFAANCNDCHGNPPALDQPGNGGYASAVIGTNTYDYKTTSGVYKDESKTAHSSHAGAADYAFSCSACHQNNQHAQGSFQDVFIAPESDLATGSGNMNPAYDNDVTNGTCSTVYCHSNGGGRTGDDTAVYNTAIIPYWSGAVAGNGKDAFNTGTYCQKCHGNTHATMDAAQNSASHGKHLDKGYSCNVCHVSTATSASALTVGKTLGQDHTHVNGQKEVAFDAGNTLSSGGAYPDPVAGTCAVYCHSNGTIQVTPDWDLAASGACGSCHKYDADGDATQDGTALTPLGGAHAAHVFLARGPKLACTVCHTNDGSPGAANTDHVNHQVSLKANYMTTVCNPCHGATASGSGYDAEPVWTNAASVTCAICHVDTLALINTRTAPAKASFYSEGHGDSGLASAPDCAGCHALTTDHIDGATDSNMLSGGAAADDAFCKTCHTSPAVQAHYDTTAGGSSTPGNTCASCHEPHGEGMGSNTDVMLVKGENFTARTSRASYANASFTGVCQTCHASSGPGMVNYFNTATDSSATHYTGNVCIDCHSHTTTPAFKASCTSCHGDDTNGNIWPDGAVAPDRLGSHEIHINAIAGAGATVAAKNATCNYCHLDGSHSGDGTVPAELGGFKNILGNANVQTAGTSQPSDGNVSCSNVDCHYTTTMPQGDWYTSGSQANCSYCHNVDDVADVYAAGDLPDAHDKHMKAAADGGRNLACINCHVDAGTDNGHQNGVIDFSTANAPLETARSIFAATGNDANQVPKYDGGAAADFVSCSTLVCHGSFIGGNTANTPNWFNIYVDAGTPGDGACGTCHGTDSAATPDNTGKHTVHLGSDFYVPGDCADCHTLAASTHVYGTVDLGGNANVASAPTCTNDCHTLDGLDNDAAATGDNPSWTSANKLGCADCHNATGKSLDQGAWPPASNKHTQHVSTAPNAAYGDTVDHTTAGAYEFGCGQCHGTTATNHVNGTKEVDLTNWTVATKTCGQNSCHQDGKGGAPVQATVDWDAAPGYTGSDVCAICHYNSPATAAHGVHLQGIHARDIYAGDTVGGLALPGTGDTAAHGNEAFSTTINCDTCHQGTVTARFNDKNSYCDDCHGSTAPAQGTMIVNVKSAHIDSGAVKVQFRNVQVKSKAQLRDNLADASLDTVWTRTVGYKAAGAYDLAAKSLTDASVTYAGGSCSSISCHNGIATPTWTSGASNCMSCHTKLPK